MSRDRRTTTQGANRFSLHLVYVLRYPLCGNCRYAHRVVSKTS